jgi:hypothetical protein
MRYVQDTILVAHFGCDVETAVVVATGLAKERAVGFLLQNNGCVTHGLKLVATDKPCDFYILGVTNECLQAQNANYG